MHCQPPPYIGFQSYPTSPSPNPSTKTEEHLYDVLQIGNYALQVINNYHPELVKGLKKEYVLKLIETMQEVLERAKFEMTEPES